MKIKILFILSVLFVILSACDNANTDADPEQVDVALVLEMVNEKRAAGCDCGSETMPPVGNVIWNDTLEFAAKNYSLRMKTDKFIDWSLNDAKMIGNDLNDLNYTYSNFSALVAERYTQEAKLINFWFGHRTYCKLLMQANMTEVGVGRSGFYYTLVLTTR